MGNNSQIKREQIQKYFTDLIINNSSENTNNLPQNQSEKISLKVSISNIEKNKNYKIQLFTFNDETKIPLSDPEICNEDSEETVICQTSFIIQYFFEKEQPILIEIIKTQGNLPSLIYPVTSTLGCIMGSRKNKLQKKIQGLQEMLIIQAEKMKQSEDVLLLKLEVSGNIPAVFTKNKNKIIYSLSTTSSKIYKSECISDMGKFEPVKIPIALLTDTLNLTFYDYRKKIVTDIKTNIQELTTQKTFDIKMNKKTKYSCVSNSRITRNYTFIDYLQA